MWRNFIVLDHNMPVPARIPAGQYARRVATPTPQQQPQQQRSLLARLRGPTGEPALRTRAFALLVVVGLIVLTAPVVVIPVVRALVHAFS